MRQPEFLETWNQKTKKNPKAENPKPGKWKIQDSQIPKTRKPQTQPWRKNVNSRKRERRTAAYPKFPNSQNPKTTNSAATQNREFPQTWKTNSGDAVNRAHEQQDDLEIQKHEMHESQEPESAVEVMESRNQKPETKNPEPTNQKPDSQTATSNLQTAFPKSKM